MRGVIVASDVVFVEPVDAFVSGITVGVTDREPSSYKDDQQQRWFWKTERATGSAQTKT
ncbi:hypothetical protein [Phaffia rhodozyma]|uniref:Uncharacterized protein n=1 Tax=Phaffia rhodozyma TaxID=264483 RepID=A0A0F7SV02_PHARH|nr:hypothetical protein [Phaffia rhodozyma]